MVECKNVILVSLFVLGSSIFTSGTTFCQSLCLCSDFSGHSGRGGHREHDNAGADRGPGPRRRTLHGHRRPSGAPGPGVPRRSDT